MHRFACAAVVRRSKSLARTFFTPLVACLLGLCASAAHAQITQLVNYRVADFNQTDANTVTLNDYYFTSRVFMTNPGFAYKRPPAQQCSPLHKNNRARQDWAMSNA